jgi:Protein of unknown function (DUF3631)
MEAYPEAAAAFADADARVELAQALLSRLQPFEDSPAELYATKTRRLPAETVRACPDLRYLPSPIEGRPLVDHALVSLLRDSAGEVSGLQCEFCDILGARSADALGKQSYSLRPNGCRDGLFHAGGSGETAHLCEGFSCKPLAVASLGLRAYGGGGLHVLGFALPRERKVVLVPDRAPPPDAWSQDGKERLLDQHEAAYTRAVDRLILAGREVLLAAPPDCACCKDSDAYLHKHGPIRLRQLLEQVTPGTLSRHGEIKRLARIADRLDRAAAIKKAWKICEVLHGIPIDDIREEVEKERGKASTKAAEPETVAPWDEPIELGAILNELVAELGRYIATPPTNFYAAALWTAMTHVYGRLYCAPKLALQSPTPGAGKTTFLDCLANVVHRPEPVSGVSASAFIRMSDSVQPTWLLDEADRSLNPKNASEELTAAINASSYRRMARIIISVPRPDGGWEQQPFAFWCPMILSGIKRLVDTVQDRSIVLVMQRAKPGELKHRLVNGTSRRFQDVQRKLLRWAQDLEGLDLDPNVPGFLHNREADLWRPLFALAAVAGGRWPQRVKQAAQTIHGQRSEDSARLIELLEAIRECFDQDGAAQLATTDLVGRLNSRSDEPWATINRGQPLNAYYLRTMLAGIVRRQKSKAKIGGKMWRGYARADFVEAWTRYIPSTPSNDPPPSGHPPPGSKKPGKRRASAVADENRPSATDAPPPAAAGTSATSGGSVADGVAASATAQAADITVKNGGGGGLADGGGSKEAPGEYTAAAGNGLDPDTEAAVVTEEIRLGYRCARCACAFTHEQGSELDDQGRYVHRGGCPEPAAPKKRRSRIKRPEQPT